MRDEGHVNLIPKLGQFRFTSLWENDTYMLNEYYLEKMNQSPFDTNYFTSILAVSSPLSYGWPCPDDNKLPTRQKYISINSSNKRFNTRDDIYV